MDAEAVADLEKPDVPLDCKWESLAPYLDLIRDGSCVRPVFETLQHFFDAEDLTADNYESISQQMTERNAPGLFNHYLHEACNIDLVLNQNRTMYQTDMFRPILPEDQFIGRGRPEDVQALAHAMGQTAPSDVASYVEMALQRLRQRAVEGMIGVKGMAFEHVPGDETAAESALGRVVAGKGTWPDTVVLVAYLRERLYEECGELNVVVVKHSGVWSGGWTDQTTIRPTNIIPVALAHRNTRFDLFHAGTPWPADAGLIARSLPNVYLNLCWSHLISPTQSHHALDIWLDMIPVNKVLGFGGDYWWAVENVYGALMQTRRLMSRVLGGRMARGEMTEQRALQVARHWLYDNPREAYFID